MQPSKVTSQSRQPVLSRSQSLAFPLTDIDHQGSLDPHLTTSPPGKKNGRRIVSSMLIVDSGSLEDEDSSEGLPGSENHFRTSLRRQKSLAELFGMALYRSKVHLHELFSRRERSGKTWQKKTKDKSVLSSQPPLQTKTSEAVGTEEPATNSSPPAALVSGGVAAVQPKLIPREPVVVGSVDHCGSDVNKTEKQLVCRVPEELFCVTREANPGEPPASFPEQKLVQSHQDFKHISAFKAKKTPSSSSNDNPAKITLKKSLSDSQWQVRPPAKQPDASLPPKASNSNGTPVIPTPPHSLVPRTLNSKLLARDSKVGVLRTLSSSTSLSGRRGSESRDCVHPIVDWLWLGSVEAAYNERLLCRLKVDAIVDITNVEAHCVPAEKKPACPCACLRSHFCAKLRLSVDDIEWENIDQYFPDTNAFIRGWRQRGSRVLVVSYHGRSRGPAFVVQHLMQHYRISMDTALAHVRARRPQTRLNPGFVRVLQRLDRRLAEQREFSDLSAPEFPPPADQILAGCPRSAWDES